MLPEPLALGQAPAGYRSGFASLVGRPNVGKSTLLNQILRRKVSITSTRPQTTRYAVRGVLTTPEAQLVFVDTPGLHKPQTVLGERLNAAVRATWSEVDVVVFVLDIGQGVGRGDAFIASELKELGDKIVCALNKVDLVDEQTLGEQRARLAELADWPAMPTSARTGAGVQELLAAVVDRLPEGPLYYPPEDVTDQPDANLVAELVREKLLEVTRDEVPHAIAVVCEEIERREGSDVLNVDVTIYVERESQKGIVVGHGGKILKDVGTRARPEIEAVLGARVFLALRVKVARDWQRREGMVRRFGYGT